VDLDRGADIRWRRTGDRLHVEQKAGTATWRVDEQHVEIAAAVASIEATNASLKLEVPMNLTDARVIGASTVTAAAVAMATVVVYEGHVKVHHGDQTVVVQPGATFVVPPPAPEPPVVHKPRVAVLGYKGMPPGGFGKHLADRVLLSAWSDDRWELTSTASKELVDVELLYDCTDEQPACMARMGQALGADLLVYGTIDQHPTGAVVQTSLFDVANAKIERTVPELIPPHEDAHDALREHAEAIYAKLTGEATACDAAALIEQGNGEIGTGQYTAALATYERAVACDPTSDHAIRLAYFASCKARDVPKARVYWGSLSAPDRTNLLPICLRAGISRDDLVADAKGSVKIACTPPARITIDGRDTGKTTPVMITGLTPGKHHVTFVIGDDRFTYAVTVKPGETATLSKDLH
jgi:hypothetical protein